MNIEFLNNAFGKRLKLTQNGNTFNILFGGNLDLYFQPDMDRMKLITNREPLEFVISEEDGFLYDAFLNLYEKITQYSPYDEIDIDSPYDEIDTYEKEYQEKKDSYRPFPLVHDKVISWHSDEEDADTSSILNISKTDNNQIKLEFIKNKPENGFYLTYAIRFRNSGSTYDPFNFRFMELYNSLCNYYENYQPNHKEKQLQK